MSNYYQREIGKALDGITAENANEEKNRLSVKVTGPNHSSRWLTTPPGIVQQIQRLYASTTEPNDELRPIHNYYAMQIQTEIGADHVPYGGWLIYDEVGSLQGFAEDNGRGRKALKDAAAALAYAGYDPRKEHWDYVVAEQIHNAFECVGPHVTVRLYVQGIVEVPASEYQTALKHGNEDNPGTRQF